MPELLNFSKGNLITMGTGARKRVPLTLKWQPLTKNVVNHYKGLVCLCPLKKIFGV